MGKFSFVLTLVFYLCLLYLNYPKPNMVGDHAMGYGLGLALSGLGIFLGSIGLFFYLSKLGVFGMLTTDPFWKNFLAVILCAAFVFAVFFSAALKWDNITEAVSFSPWLANMNSLIWFPLLIFIPSFLVHFLGKEPSFTPVRIFFPIGFMFSLVFTIGLLMDWLVYQSKQQKEMISQILTQDKEQHETYMSEIEGLDSTQSILGILPLTGKYHDAEVREAAVAKIKSRPHWESELIGILVSEYNYHYAYDFLDGNNVDHPRLFIEPVRLSILQMATATDIRAIIPNADNLQEWAFDHFGIERLLRVVDGQLAGQGMDFYPAILEVRKALDTTPPEQYKGIKYSVIPTLDNWIKKNAR
ncbi:hypothetical protein MMU07_05545 [Aquiflexum sp. LQ15W]|uniref:hypothetical protein n=1 Tax=Cognataquiflexum nitidum TaxID=2922272 RepID=UPI001F132509|nr:hypothetical protein [Cognataquiflexum nitidum]MCH6199028.1 hypothetical protein [Cognataquiflexum nitidum]